MRTVHLPTARSLPGVPLVKVKGGGRKPMKLAYVEHVGAYGSIPFDRYFEQLYGWAKERKVRPGFHPLGIMHDSPKETPPERCRAGVAVPVFGYEGAFGDVE